MPARLVAAPAVLLCLLVGTLSVTAPAGAAPVAGTASHARAAGPAYGPWSSYYYDLRARVATPTKQRARLNVQVNRTTARTGDRQVRLLWKPAGQSQRSTAIKSVAPGQTVVLTTAPLPCGRTQATLMGRGRAPGASSYGAWKSLSADIRRRC